jgi:hypothetical protein
VDVSKEENLGRRLRPRRTSSGSGRFQQHIATKPLAAVEDAVRWLVREEDVNSIGWKPLFLFFVFCFRVWGIFGSAVGAPVSPVWTDKMASGASQ